MCATCMFILFIFLFKNFNVLDFLRISYTSSDTYITPSLFLPCNFSQVTTPPPKFMTSLVIIVALHKCICAVYSLQIPISTACVCVCACVWHRVTGRKDQHTGAKVAQFGEEPASRAHPGVARMRHTNGLQAHTTRHCPLALQEMPAKDTGKGTYSMLSNVFC